MKQIVVGLAEGMSGKFLNDVIFCTETNVKILRERLKQFIIKMKGAKFAEAYEFLPKLIEMIIESINGCNNSDAVKVFISDLNKISVTLKKFVENKDEILLNVMANASNIIKDVQTMVKGFKGDRWLELG